MSNTCGVYGIFSLTGECLYIGQSRAVELRWKKHLSLLKSGKHKRIEFVSWYERNEGPTSIRFQILETFPEGVTDTDLNVREIFWFDKLTPKFYGKRPSSAEIWQQSEASKEKIRKGLNEYYSSKPRVMGGRVSDVLGEVPETQCFQCGELFRKIRGTTSKKFFCSRRCQGNYNSKLTPEQREEIRSRYPKESLRNLGREFGVSHISIRNIVCST